jgi:hypothetical protein
MMMKMLTRVLGIMTVTSLFVIGSMFLGVNSGRVLAFDSPTLNNLESHTETGQSNGNCMSCSVEYDNSTHR